VTLKQKSLVISLCTTVAFLMLIIAVIYQIITVQFQKIENQRVERNIRRVSAIIDDRFNQINTKLADWTIWDDTYQFLQDKNKAYITSNLTQESFANIGIDEALFIDKNGALVTSILATNNPKDEEDFPQDLYTNFATGSALTKINSDTKFNSGLITSSDGLLFFVVREVFKSDGSGKPAGTVVFARYFDDKILNSLKDLTQFEAQMYLWNDPNMTSDYQDMKKIYQKGQKELVRVLDNNTISGYQVIVDVYGQPQAIVRSDIGRDITLQGKSAMYLLMWLLTGAGLLTAFINYWLLAGGVFRKISQIAGDVDTLSQSEGKVTHLEVGKTSDEVDKLRQEINIMLDILQQSKSQLTSKERFIDTILDSVTIGIAVNQISTGKAVYMNPAFEKIYGWSKDILTSVDTFFENVYPDPVSGKELKSRVTADIQSGDINRMHWHDLEITKSNGQKAFIDARNIPLPDQDLMVSTVTDVTEERDVEVKREAYSKELEKINELMVNRELKMIALKKQLKNYQK
jgi:PAS domain S-box-containing protein